MVVPLSRPGPLPPLRPRPPRSRRCRCGRCPPGGSAPAAAAALRGGEGGGGRRRRRRREISCLAAAASTHRLGPENRLGVPRPVRGAGGVGRRKGPAEPPPGSRWGERSGAGWPARLWGKDKAGRGCWGCRRRWVLPEERGSGAGCSPAAVQVPGDGQPGPRRRVWRSGRAGDALGAPREAGARRWVRVGKRSRVWVHPCSAPPDPRCGAGFALRGCPRGVCVWGGHTRVPFLRGMPVLGSTAVLAVPLEKQEGWTRSRGSWGGQRAPPCTRRPAASWLGKGGAVIPAWVLERCRTHGW